VARRVRVRIYSTQIQGLFTPPGQVNREMRSLAREIHDLAKAKSMAFRGPQVRKRPQARIRDSHSIEGPTVRRMGVSVDVVNTSPHAFYKHEGTEPIIESRRGSYMQIPKGPWGPRRAEFVAGQIGEPWMRDAADEVILRRYGV